MTYERFIDRKDKKQIIKSCADFRFRRHGMPPGWVLYSFIVAMLMVVIMINYMSMKLILLPDNEPTPIAEMLAFLFTVSSIILGISFASYMIIRKVSDIVLHTEFQNLLFASSAGLQSKFCLIVNASKIVVYFNHHFDQFFTENPENLDQLDRLLSSVKDEEKEKILNAIVNSKEEKLKIKFKQTNEELELHIDPLPRPQGFSIIRAY